MSEKAPITVVGMGAELGYGGYRAPPFTDVQWKELEQQAMIYKYMVAGLPVPPDLVTPIRHSYEGLYAHIFNHPALGYCSYYGKKFDPEPGRCRRTDGKKWRCSKDAHPDSKYCERHMHRGRNRSRKHVESQSTSQSLLTAIPLSNTGGGTNRGTSQQMPLYFGANSDGSSAGSNATKLQMGPISYGIDSSREFSFSQESSGRVGSLGLGPSASSGMWSLAPSQAPSSSLFKQDSDSRLLGSSSAQLCAPHAFEPVSASSSKQQQQQQQQGFYGNEISSAATVKHEHIFFGSNKESWSDLDNSGSNQNAFSSTQLSMSIPRASSDFTYSSQNH